MMKQLLNVFLVLLLALSGCSSLEPRDDPQGIPDTKVLFIGNSYIYANDLPQMFAALAQASQHKVTVETSAYGGWTLAEHARSAETSNLVNSTGWNFVVLQEQSRIPSVEYYRTQEMYPAARTLVKQVRDAGATPLFFLTWAHRSGWPEAGMNDYQSMQAEINNGYYLIARELEATVVPVGPAWHSAVEQYPDLTLWQEDGSHPAREGTYLAACAFYAAIFQESPAGLPYRAGLSKDVAERLQRVASKTVLNIP